LHAQHGHLDYVEIEMTRKVLCADDPVACRRGYRQDRPEDDGDDRPVAGQGDQGFDSNGGTNIEYLVQVWIFAAVAM
jgi:hypothetical protein